jgi:hypothetical protein
VASLPSPSRLLLDPSASFSLSTAAKDNGLTNTKSDCAAVRFDESFIRFASPGLPSCFQTRQGPTPPAKPTLDYGQTRNLDAITCGSEPIGITCTDSSTGHYFRISRESYDAG